MMMATWRGTLSSLPWPLAVPFECPLFTLVLAMGGTPCQCKRRTAADTYPFWSLKDCGGFEEKPAVRYRSFAGPSVGQRARAGNPSLVVGLRAARGRPGLPATAAGSDGAVRHQSAGAARAAPAGSAPGVGRRPAARLARRGPRRRRARWIGRAPTHLCRGAW